MKFENDEELDLMEKLFLPTPMPIGFKRKKPTAFRFQPYSRKLRRRLDIYSSILYDLWVHLEWSPEIKLFNERVNKFPVAGKDSKIFYWAPRMVSTCDRTDCWVHAIRDMNDEDAELFESDGEDYIQAWADVNQLKLKIWSPEEIRKNPIELENRQQLYAYLSNPETIISPVLRENVLLVLRRYRKTTLVDLIETLGDQCADSVIQVIAELLMDRSLYSDIHKFPFGWTTEISCFHELP